MEFRKAFTTKIPEYSCAATMTLARKKELCARYVDTTVVAPIVLGENKLLAKALLQFIDQAFYLVYKVNGELIQTRLYLNFYLLTEIVSSTGIRCLTIADAY